jgi:2-hydroxy-3-oxopropionate reductase
MLPDWPDIEQAVLGEDGVLDFAEPNLLYIDMSAVRPETARRIASLCATRKMRLDAPARGSEHDAIAGALPIMVGGWWRRGLRCARSVSRASRA